MSNVIVTENQNVGTTAWKVTKAQTTQIQGYCDQCSYGTSDTVTFFISTQSAGTSYTITIYRLGWYGSTGGCLKHTSPTQTGVAQGYWNNGAQTLNNCPTAITDASTHNLETGWTSSYTWTVPSNAVTGVYVALFQDANGWQWCCTFVVKGNPAADYVYVLDHTASCAYNAWGGNSLYSSNSVGGVAATKDSFNRPDSNGNGTGNLYQFNMCLIKWMEQMGYNLSYLSNVDVHVNAAQLLNYGAYLSGCHDEYWTKEMRDGVEAAIAAGVGAAFMGANTCYWQMRFEADHAGNSNRTVVCYRSTGTDPQYGVDNSRVTILWRDPLIGRPENRMIGIMYNSFTDGANAAWTVDPTATSAYLTGTGLVAGSSYGSDLVGYEWDKVFAGGPTNLQTIGTSIITGGSVSPDTSNTTTYVAAGGGLVFASGSVGWVGGLDTYRFAIQQGTVIPGMQQLMAHIMTALIRPKNPTGFSAFASGHR